MQKNTTSQVSGKEGEEETNLKVDEDENIEKQIISNKTKDVQLPALSKLNEEDGRVSQSNMIRYAQ